MSVKTKTLFDHLKAITQYQDPNYWEKLSDADKKTFLIQREKIEQCIKDGHVPDKSVITLKKNHRVQQGAGKYKEMDLYVISIDFFSKYCDEISTTAHGMTYESINFNVVT